MPVYVYACSLCEYEGEMILSIKSNGRDKLDCPICGEKKYKRIPTKANFIINGAKTANDFYIPPKNEDIGLPSERDLKHQYETADDFLDFIHHGKRVGEDKEAYQEQKKKEREAVIETEKYYGYLKDKHKVWANKIEGHLQKAHDKLKNDPKADKTVTDRIEKRVKLAEEFAKDYKLPEKGPEIKISVENK